MYLFDVMRIIKRYNRADILYLGKKVKPGDEKESEDFPIHIFPFSSLFAPFSHPI